MLAAVREGRPKCVDHLGGPRNILTAPSRARLRALSQIISVRGRRVRVLLRMGCAWRYAGRLSHAQVAPFTPAPVPLRFMTSEVGGREMLASHTRTIKLGLFVVVITAA